MASTYARLTEKRESDLLAEIRKLFSEHQSGSDQLKRVKYEVFDVVIDVLEDDTVSKDTYQQLISKLGVEADGLKKRDAGELVEKIINKIKNMKSVKGRSIELLPLLFSVLETHSKQGISAKKELIETLHLVRWPTMNVCGIVTMLRDLKLTEQELQMFCEKTLLLLRSMRPLELPPIVHQLLALSSTKGSKRLILNGILYLFTALDKEVEEADHATEEEITVAPQRHELLQAEGTVMLHISYAIQNNQELDKELLDIVKSSTGTMPASVISPFCVATLLSLSYTQRLQDQIFVILKTALINTFKNNERRRGSKWLKNVTGESPDVQQYLLTAVTNSNHGWDYVLQGLVKFAFYLLEGFVPKALESPFGDAGSAMQQLSDTGTKLLVSIYEMHRIARKEIVDQVLRKIGASAATYAKHYISILYILVRKPETRDPILECIPRIQEVLNYISFFPVTTAISFLEAVQPLLKYSINLKESLLSTLNEALFSKTVERRSIAVKGYVMLLRSLKMLDEVLLSSQSSQPLSGSQIFVELHGNNRSASNEALCLEILSMLRRCFSQQSEVRTCLYQGLLDVFVDNPKLQVPILELLVNHLKMYCASDLSELPPILYANCLKEGPGGPVQVTEPVDVLLRSVILCYLKYQEDVGEDNECESVRKVFQLLKSLALSMCKLEPADVGLSKDVSTVSNSTVGSKSVAMATLVMKSCDVLMEFVYGVGEFSQQSSDQIVHLHTVRQEVGTMAQDQGTGVAGSKRTAGRVPQSLRPQAAPFQSCLSVQGTASLLKGIYNDTLPVRQPGLGVLRKSLQFCQYLLGTSCQQMNALVETGQCCGMQVTELSKLNKVFCVFGRAYFKQLELLSLPGSQPESSKGKSPGSLCVDGLAVVVQLACNADEEGRRDLLFPIVSSGDVAPDSVSEVSLYLIRKLQRLINGIISDPPEVLGLTIKDAISMATIILNLSHLLDEVEEVAEIIKWSHEVCKETKRDDINFCKGFLGLLFGLCQRYDQNIRMLRKICYNVRALIGDIDEEVEIQPKNNLSVITSRTVTPCCLTLVLHQLDLIVDDVEWFVSRLKVGSPESQPYSLNTTADTDLEGMFDSLCKERLTMIIHCFHELIQTAIAPGSIADHLVKLLIRLYGTFKELTKYVMCMLNTCGGEPDMAYMKMVELTGTHLNPQIYAFISYLQTVQVHAHEPQGGGQGKKGKGKPLAPSNIKKNTHKELVNIPKLIFAIEEYEKFLIKVGKKAKIDLMKTFKRSTARDFKINISTVTAKLAEEMDDESVSILKEGNEEDGEQEGGEQEPMI